MNSGSSVATPEKGRGLGKIEIGLKRSRLIVRNSSEYICEMLDLVNQIQIADTVLKMQAGFVHHLHHRIET